MACSDDDRRASAVVGDEGAPYYGSSALFIWAKAILLAATEPSDLEGVRGIEGDLI